MDKQDILDELLKDYATVPDHTAAKTDTAADAEPPAEELPVGEAVLEEEIITEEEMPVEEDGTEEESVAEEPPADGEIRVAPLEAPTQIVSIAESEETAAETTDDADDDVDDGQITMAELAGEEEPPVEESPEEVPDWEEQLIKTRQEKIRDFQIKQNRESLDFRFEGDTAPDEESERKAEEPHAAQRRAVASPAISPIFRRRRMCARSCSTATARALSACGLPPRRARCSCGVRRRSSSTANRRLPPRFSCF